MLLISALVLSLATGSIRGTIVEARTGQALAAVLIRVQETGQQAISDGDGRFEIADVPAGPQTLLVSVVGYGLVRRDLEVKSGEAVDITLAVSEGASTYVESVVVGAPAFRDAEAGVAAQAVLGSRDLLALRGVIADDPFRAVQALPEVATGDDFRAEFAVRGLGPEHTGIAVDGVDTPLLFHTVRGVNDTGSLALINTDVLESATLVAGAYPQRAGAHLGARLDFTTRDGARDRVRARSMLGVTAVTGVFEGPLGSRSGGDARGGAPTARGSWLVALRRSYLGWLLSRLDSEMEGAFGFTDGQATAAWDLSSRQSIRATAIVGRSTWTEHDPMPDPNTFDQARNRSLIANLQWRLAASPRLTLQQQAYVVDATYRNTVIDGRTREEGGDRDITWRGGATATLGQRHTLEAGGQVQWLRGWRADRVFTAIGATMAADARESWSGGGAWLHYRWAATRAISLSPGVRADWSGLTRDQAVSPYVLADWQLAANWRVRGGAGRQHQFATLDQKLGGNPAARVDLEPERAWTADAGVAWQPSATWRLRLDGYYREEHDRLRFERAEFRRSGSLIVRPVNPFWANALNGSAAGAVITVERRQSNGLSGWISFAGGRTSLSDSLTAERFVSDYDQAHTLNAYAIYRTSRKLSLSARYRYGSNFPLAGYFEPTADEVWTLAEQRNRARLPAYNRLDVRADWAFTYRRSRLTLFTEIVNTTARTNYGPDSATLFLPSGTVVGLTQTLFPFLPSAGVLIEF
jgi:hypothetical protein